MIRVIARPLCWLGWVVVLTTFSVDLYSQESMEQKKETKRSIVDFARDIEPLFSSRCNECHRGADGKGGFDVTDKDVVLGYVTAGSAEKSPLWTDYLMADPSAADSMVMPPAAKGRLAPAELALLRTWIEEGAEWNASPPQPLLANDAPIEKLGWVQRAWQFQGYFHPAVVHFPIALISIAAASLVFSFFAGKRAEDFAKYCLVIGAVFATVAAMMGWSFASIRGYPSWTSSLASQQDATFFWHRWLGLSVAILAWITALFAIVSVKIPKVKLAWKIGLLVLALLVAIVGHQGGELTYGDQMFHDAFDLILK